MEQPDFFHKVIVKDDSEYWRALRYFLFSFVLLWLFVTVLWTAALALEWDWFGGFPWGSTFWEEVLLFSACVLLAVVVATRFSSFHAPRSKKFINASSGYFATTFLLLSLIPGGYLPSDFLLAVLVSAEFYLLTLLFSRTRTVTNRQLSPTGGGSST